MPLPQVPATPGTPPSQIPLMVIDDDPLLLETVSELLSFEGYDVYTACTESKALALADELQPWCILLDLKLRETDGYTLLKKFKRRRATRHIPIIVLSAYSQERYREDALALGAFGYITKPFSTEALLAEIRQSILGRTSCEQHLSH